MHEFQPVMEADVLHDRLALVCAECGQEVQSFELPVTFDEVAGAVFEDRAGHGESRLGVKRRRLRTDEVREVDGL